MFKKLIAFLLFLCIAQLVWLYFQNKPEKVPEYVTDTVEKRDVTKVVSVTGSLETQQRIQVQSPISEFLMKLIAKEGGTVKKGQVVAILDNQNLALSLMQAEAQLAQAEAGVLLSSARKTTTEDIRLAEQDIAAAEKNLEIAKRNLEQIDQTQEKNREQAELSRELAKADLQRIEADYHNIKSQNKDVVTTNDQGISQAYAGAQDVADEAMSLLREAQRTTNEVTQQDSDITETGSYAGVNFGNRNIKLKNQVVNQYSGYKNNLNRFLEDEYQLLVSDHENPLSYLQRIEVLILEAKLLVDQANEVVADTIGVNDTSSLAVISELGGQLNNLETLLNASNAKLVASRQRIETAKLSQDTSETSRTGRVDQAAAALIAAGVRYDQAKKSIEQVAVQNEDLYIKTLSEVEVREEAVARAKLALAKVKANPRAVEIAGPKAQVKVAQATIAQAEFNLGKAEIKSPIAGIVTDIMVEEGEPMSLFQPMMTVMSPELKLIADVVETDIADLKVGQKAKVDFDAFSDNEVFEAKVFKISSSEKVLQGVIYYEVEFSLTQKKNNKLKSGLTGNIDIEVEGKKAVVAIDPQSIEYEDGFAKVYVLDGMGKKQERIVEVGLEGDDFVEIIKGIEVGDKVVLYEEEA